MREIKQSRKTRYTQMVLKDSLMELMKEKAITKITIRELCEKADINRTTFYKHYSDQYQLLKSVEDETLEWVKQAVAGFMGRPDKKDFISRIEEVINYIFENKNHIQVLMSERGDIGFQRNLLGVLYEQSGVWLVDGPGADMEKNELYFVFIVNGSIGLIQHWLKTGLRETAGELAEIIYNMTYGIS